MPVLRHTLFAAVACASLFPAIARAETVNLTLLFASDLYNVDNTEPRGGFARLNAVVKAERARNVPVVYAFGGDLISPSLLSSFDQGEHTIALMNAAPPDIFVPGNHEFDFGPEVFAKRMAEAQFPRYAANLRQADGQPVPGFQDTSLRDVGGVKVGFVGITAEDSPEKASPGKAYVFAPSLDTTVAKAKELREQGADVVVAVVHAAQNVDRAIVDSRAADIVLSGDDHDLTVFYDGRTVYAEGKSEADYVTAVDLTIDVKEKDGKRSVKWFPDFRIIDTATVTPDADTQKMVDQYRQLLSAELDVAIGTTAEALDSRKASVRTQETSMGNLVADATRWAVSADIAITNGGGIRGNKEYPAGSALTRRDILSELPFGNRTVKLAVTGDMVWQALENGFSDVENSAGRFPQVSGLVVTADLGKPKGERVQSVTVDGKPLDKAASYTLATNDYMMDGGDGYKVLKGAKPLFGVRDARLMANDVMAYVKEKGTGGVKAGGRIILKK
jgi:2',3'-cyclic-nucleotide 2'-phosphodiesterase (5'-nucleotidase family)